MKYEYRLQYEYLIALMWLESKIENLPLMLLIITI